MKISLFLSLTLYSIVRPSFSQSFTKQHLVKRAGDITPFNPFHEGYRETPFSSTNPNQSPVQNRIIRTREPVNRPPELPANHPIVKPKLPKVEYEDDEQNHEKKQKEKKEPLLHPLATLTPLGMLITQDIVFEDGKFTKLASRKMKQKAMEICDAACRKAKQFQNHILPQSMTSDYGKLQLQDIHNVRNRKKPLILVTRDGPVHERQNDHEATSSEGYKETKSPYRHLSKSPPRKYKDSHPQSSDNPTKLEPNKFEWLTKNASDKENPVKLLFNIEGPGKESKIRAMNSRRTGKGKFR